MVTPARAPEPGPSAVTIGRSPNNTLAFASGAVSLRHAYIEPRPQGYVLVGLDQTVATFVNGAPVREHTLREGDRISLGDIDLTFAAGQLTPSSRARSGLIAEHVGFTVPGGPRLLGPLSFAVASGTLTAVIGPSGAGKSTLFRVLTGATQPSTGHVLIDGLDVHDCGEYFRTRLGVVPQEDILHHQLEVGASLNYAAALRFPHDLDDVERRTHVVEVLTTLQLEQQENVRVSTLSGGQRKRTSVAMELLTTPRALFLDEPTSGLDPALDRSIMRTLRGLADAGRTVVVVTHAVANLDVCDRVVVLAPGGRLAYLGPPDSVLATFRAGDHADLFSRLSEWSDPHDRGGTTIAAPSRASADPAPSGPAPIAHQVRTLLRRQWDILRADRSSLALNAALPIILGLLCWAIPGGDGLRVAGAPSSEAMQILVVLVVGAVFMGMASTSRDLVSERSIFLREKAVGLSPTAYLASKVIGFGALATVQTSVMLTIASLGKPLPDEPVLLPIPGAELWLSLALTSMSGVAFGLLISAYVGTSVQSMPVLVVAVMLQLILCGGIVPVAGRFPLSQLSLLTPARWGFAASATSTHVLDSLGVPREDALWEPFASTWLFTLIMLGFLTLGVLTLTVRRLERQ